MCFLYPLPALLLDPVPQRNGEARVSRSGQLYPFQNIPSTTSGTFAGSLETEAAESTEGGTEYATICNAISQDKEVSASILLCLKTRSLLVEK